MTFWRILGGEMQSATEIEKRKLRTERIWILIEGFQDVEDLSLNTFHVKKCRTAQV